MILCPVLLWAHIIDLHVPFVPLLYLLSVLFSYTGTMLCMQLFSVKGLTIVAFVHISKGCESLSFSLSPSLWVCVYELWILVFFAFRIRAAGFIKLCAVGSNMIRNIVISVTSICMCAVNLCLYMFLLNFLCAFIAYFSHYATRLGYLHVCWDFTSKYSAVVFDIYQSHHLLKVSFFGNSSKFNCDIYILVPNLTRTLSTHVKASSAAALLCRDS